MQPLIVLSTPLPVQLSLNPTIDPFIIQSHRFKCTVSEHNMMRAHTAGQGTIANNGMRAQTAGH